LFVSCGIRRKRFGRPTPRNTGAKGGTRSACQGEPLPLAPPYSRNIIVHPLSKHLQVRMSVSRPCCSRSQLMSAAEQRRDQCAPCHRCFHVQVHAQPACVRHGYGLDPRYSLSLEPRIISERQRNGRWNDDLYGIYCRGQCEPKDGDGKHATQSKRSMDDGLPGRDSRKKFRNFFGRSHLASRSQFVAFAALLLKGLDLFHG